jgi:hypothetical protein
MGRIEQASVGKFRLRPDRAEATIKSKARETRNVIFGDHAKEQADHRDIPKDEVFRILRTGTIKGDPEKARRGEWKCKMIKRIRGGRDAGIVVIILRNGRLFIKTVEWEDL